MTRAIRLSRIHALNWYGYRDSIAVDGNLLLAGVTGSGKSILMDLIQYVLVGDLRLVKFNQSATGAHSDRSLKGYCLGDTKQEEAGVTQYMRDSAITIVALEFTWPDGKKAETWGFRIEFASAAEAHGRVTPFFVPASLARADFLDAEKRPLEHAAFRAMVESHGKKGGPTGRTYGEQSEYLAHMCQPAHLNFDRSVLRVLLPTAMSFTFLKSFNDFCRNFILSAERLDVRDVTDSYRAFLRYEKDLKLLNDQFTRLQEICERYTRFRDLERDAWLARYLEAETRDEHAAALLQEDEEELAKLKAACAEEDARLGELENLIPQRSAELETLKNTIRETPDGSLYLELKSRVKTLAGEIASLERIGESLETALAARVRAARQWAGRLAATSLKLESATIEEIERAGAAMESGGIAEFGKNSKRLGETMQAALSEFGRLAQPTVKRLSEIRSELGQLREQIAALQIGKLPFPTRLLDALNHALYPTGPDLRASHLRELCEVRDGEEMWRPAIEVAFTRKFAVVVSAADYNAAEEIYHELREEAPRESLVNPVKALKSARQTRPGSLAEKLKTSHPVAEAIVAHLFGELICVEKREELRLHDAAITPDGFLTRGAFVERPRHYDNLPFVGRRGLAQQLAWKVAQRDRLEAEEKKLRPLENDLQEIQGRGREIAESPASLWEDLARASDLPKKCQERDATITRLNGIDRDRFDDLAKQQSELETQIETLTQERLMIYKSEQRTLAKQLAKSVEIRREKAREAEERFEKVGKERDVSEWLPRLGELRDEVRERFPVRESAAAEFMRLFNRDDKEAVAEREKVLAARRELAMTHPKFDDLPQDADDNAAYDRQLEKLRESEIPDYSAKSERERQTWEKLFRTQLLEKLRSALSEIENTRVLLNSFLRTPIGNNRYRIVKWPNPDFAIYHRLLDASAVAHEDELFFASADAELRDAIKTFLGLLVDQPDSAEAARLLDYRHYYEYDMEVDDLDEGVVTGTSRVDRQSGKFSGGENQSPYFIAILASYLRAYKRHDRRSRQPSLALVPIDEAFSKLSGERIKDCIGALKSLDLQGVFSMSTGNIPYAFEHCESLVVVAKEERRIGKRPHIRNIPVSLHRDSPEARTLLGLEEEEARVR